MKNNICGSKYSFLVLASLLAVLPMVPVLASEAVLAPIVEEGKEVTITEEPAKAAVESKEKADKAVPAPALAKEKTKTSVLDVKPAQEAAPAPSDKQEEKYMVRDAITGQKVEQVSPIKPKEKKTLRDEVRAKLKKD